MIYNQMDVWFADFKYEDNKIISEERPVLILAAVGADFVKVLKGTTNINTPMRRLVINHKAAGLNRQTAFFMNKVYLIKKSALLYRVGKISFSDCVQVLDMLNVNAPIPTIVLESKSENHSISPKISEFIEKNIELIDNNDWKMLAVQGVAYNLLPVNWLELFNIMKKVLSVDEDKIMEAKWAAFDMMFLGEIIHLGNQAKNDLFERRANSWSRLDYVLEGMGYPFDLEHKDIVNHLLKPEIQKSLNIKMRPLSAEYGWYGEGDYDLGWFNETYFDKYMRDGN